MTTYLYDWTNFPEVTGLREGTTRRAVSGEKLSVITAEITADCEFKKNTLHRHDAEQFFIMLEGDLQLQVEQERFWVKPGQFVYIPGGAYHSAIGVGSNGCKYIEIFSPPRFDQLIGYVGPSPLEFKTEEKT